MPDSLGHPKARKAFHLAGCGFVLLLVACGRASLDDAVVATGSSGTGGSSTTGQAGQGGTSPGCEAEIAGLSKELHTSGQACTVVVRLEFQTRSILGYQVVCAPASNGVSEEAALNTAVLETNISPSAGLVSDGAGTPTDELVFFATPSDFGGIAAVSATTGHSVFGGTIVFGGRGDITYPMTWRAAAGLGAGCPSQPGVALRHGWDALARAPLSVANIDAADLVVERTAIPAAFAHGGNGASVFVLLYPRTVGVVDPDATAEWIVMINGE